MSYILYYSNHCQHSKSILYEMSKYNHNDVHFICIDKRVTEDGKIKIVLENGQKILLPETINCVPSMLLLNEQYKILTGKDILIKFTQQQQNNGSQTNTSHDPTSYAFDNRSGFVVSDSFGYYNEDHCQQSKQMHNYMPLNGAPSAGWFDVTNNNNGEKKKESIEKLQSERENELAQFQKR